MENININYQNVLKQIWKKKKTFTIVTIVTIVVASLLIFPIPRYYKCSIMLAPEINGSDMDNKVSTIASTLGFSIGGGSTSDAISPMLYPKLVESNDFIYKLLNIKIKTRDGKISTDYYTYLDKYQKVTPYMIPFYYIESKIQDIATTNKQKETFTNSHKINPAFLSKKETKIFGAIKGNVNCDYDLKTGMISVNVEDQDPLVAATIVDSVCSKLQEYIINYRTQKARVDEKYYKKLALEAKNAYEKSRQLYSSYADANMDVLLESYKSKVEDLENDMQLKFNTYNQMNTQLQAARAKVQEATPVFTVVQSSTVPTIPAGPKRMAMILCILFITEFCTLIYVLKDLLFTTNKHEQV